MIQNGMLLFFALALCVGILLFGSVIRHMVKVHAFNGFSKNRIKKILKEQPILKRVFMTYATKVNTTRWYCPVGTWWCLICYYIFLFSLTVLIFCTLIVLFFYIDFDGWVLEVLLYAAGISWVASILSGALFSPPKRK